jgi:phosphoribosylformylglycinamidine cyclo-ligase
MSDIRGARSGGAWDAYREAGVDVDAGERAVELMRASVAATRRPEVLGGLGGFASAMRLPSGMREPVLVSSTDGVGTKTAIAMALGRYDTVGRDLVAMCADDLVCAGAEPLFFLDYVAVGRLVPEQVASLVAGIADGCIAAGCSLIGGETAEHPGLMEPDEFDLAGFCVGVVERDRLMDGTAVRAGDALIGLAASGLHSNGYSLVRRIVATAGLNLEEGYADLVCRILGPDAPAEPETEGLSLGEVLLTPTRIYAQSILRLRRRLAEAGSDLHGVAHVTGGGLPGNVPRMLPDGLGAPAELRSTFNGGLGMVCAVPGGAVETAISSLDDDGVETWHVGAVGDSESVGGRYTES